LQTAQRAGRHASVPHHLAQQKAEQASADEVLRVDTV